MKTINQKIKSKTILKRLRQFLENCAIGAKYAIEH
jgi:hypothetical protein